MGGALGASIGNCAVLCGVLKLLNSSTQNVLECTLCCSAGAAYGTFEAFRYKVGSDPLLILKQRLMQQLSV